MGTKKHWIKGLFSGPLGTQLTHEAQSRIQKGKFRFALAMIMASGNLPSLVLIFLYQMEDCGSFT